MSTINSPLGKTKIQGAEPRRFTVPDESGNAGAQSFSSSEPVIPPGHENYEQSAESVDFNDPNLNLSSRDIGAEELMAVRQKLIQQRTQQSSQDKSSERRRIEILLGIGREFKDVVINVPGGKAIFKLQTLKSKERRHVAKMLDIMYKVKTEESLHDVRNTILSYCINSVDNISLDMILNCSDLPENDRFYVRESFIREMDDNVIHFLYKNFEILDDSSKSKYNLDTEEGVKEVAEAIKKS